jgi:hypothetical protein
MIESDSAAGESLGSSRGVSSSGVVVRRPIFRPMSPQRKKDAVAALTQLMLAQFEEEALVSAVSRSHATIWPSRGTEEAESR